ncbi:MAG TPA: NAD(P)H-binding protein [Flavisolibacter sp.]|nr:NAD(P)H-binding protein [Flavisolibacter sp.]
MKLLVFGASGATGIQLVKQALAGGHEVTAFVRNIRKLPLRHKNLILAEGDVGHAEKVYKAVAGQDAVLSALGANQLSRFDPIIVNGLGYIIDAMGEKRVERLIYLSTMGVKAARPQAGWLIRALAPTVLRHEISGHERREKMILDSPLQWTIVRAPILTRGALTGRYKTGEGLRSNRLAPRISRADVAHCMLNLLSHAGFEKKLVNVMTSSKK